KGRRRSRESTISAEEDNEELARQAVKSFTSLASSQTHSQRHDGSGVFGGSQASQAATEMLRRHPREGFEVIDSSAGSGSRDEGPAERMKLFSNLRADTDKRKFSGGGA